MEHTQHDDELSPVSLELCRQLCHMRWTSSPSKRYFAPITRLPRVGAWPEHDQAAWQRACFKAGPLDEPGRLAHLRPLSLDETRKAWARFLTFFSVSGELADHECPADRLTPERLGRFILSLRDRLSPSTVQLCVFQLVTAIDAMEPNRDWRWVRGHPGRPRNAEVQLGLKRVIPPDPAALLAGALDYCDAADGPHDRIDRAIQFRDGLVVALGTYFAPRRRNIFELRIGEHLIVGDSGIRLVLDSTVKNGEIIDSVMPKTLETYMRRYLTHQRMVILQSYPDTPAVWISRYGNQLSYGSLYLLFQRIGERVTGHRINVHSVRYAMATTTLDNDAHDIDLASAGLAHLGTSSVARVYDKGGPERANRAWHAIRRRRRSRR
jgi:integrase/recombinase XerD